MQYKSIIILIIIIIILLLNTIFILHYNYIVTIVINIFYLFGIFL